MSIVDKKRKIFGNIAAAKTLTNGLPKLNTSSSFPSINNGGNSITFLSDLIKSLIGYDALVSTLVSILSHTLPDIEREIKIALKNDLKTLTSCGVDPSIPSWLKSSGTGIVIPVSQIDFYDLLKVDPNSTSGKLLYGDSTDFNVFLYNTIQNEGVVNTWNGMLDFTFNAIGVVNNTLTIKAHSTYNTKTLTDLNNNFIDSLSLFNSVSVINNLIDNIFGTIAIDIKKTTSQLQKEAQIDNVINNIIDSDFDDPIDDSYFTFTNEEVTIQNLEASQRKNGILKLECCNKVSANVPIELLNNLNSEMSASTPTQQTDIIASNLNAMANANTVNSTDSADKITIKLNFIQKLINNLIKTIVSIILSPKVTIIFLINYKIIYGQSATYNGGVDFIKANKNLFKNISKTISGIIIKILLTIALKEIATLVAETVAMRQVERGKSKLAQLLSLVGVPQDTLRLIKGFT